MDSLRLFIRTITILCLAVTFVSAKDIPTIQDVYVGDVFKYPVLKLGVTQSAVGYREVKLKAKKFADMSHDELRDELKGDPVKVVAAPDGKFYIIDHHHESLAAYKVGRENIFCELVNDFSKMKTMDEFWEKMKEKKFTWLMDQHGHEISPYHLPKNILGLADDPYRSLAYFVRKAGGYCKTKLPFAEFYWAEYFRRRLKIDERDYDATIKRAEKLAHDNEARALPGYTKENVGCSNGLKP